MENDIIELYKNTSISIDDLAKKYKVGKIKIKKILIDNNVIIRKKGNQIKNRIFVDFKINLTNKIIKCKKCGIEYNDVENKSGCATDHIPNCFPEIHVPNRYKRSIYKKETGEYWHFQYFDLVDKKELEYIKCPECDWITTDLINQSGSFTKHIEKHHGSISEFLDRNPDHIKYFNVFFKNEEREIIFDKNIDNFIICKICGDRLKAISNTHLKTHNITSDKYRSIFGDDSLISRNSSEIFKNNLINSVHNIKYRSNEEIEIEDFLKSNNVLVDVCNKSILSGIELDIFLPEYNVAIEYNGLYWHSEKQGKTKEYHIDKTNKCLQKNIRLIHIFSDEWRDKKEIIKDRLLNIIHKNDNKIFARKCDVVELTKTEKKCFLNKHHLQGNDKSKIFIGLKYSNEIVAVLTFGYLRKSTGNKNIDNNVYELYRYASNNVVGGFKKMISFFIEKYSPSKIITYADRNWSPSDDFCFYSKVGFKFISETKPNYYYTKRYNKREHRFNYRKDILVKLGFDKNKTETQIMMESGYDRIWDTGNLKYEMVI